MLDLLWCSKVQCTLRIHLRCSRQIEWYFLEWPLRAQARPGRWTSMKSYFPSRAQQHLLSARGKLCRDLFKMFSKRFVNYTRPQRIQYGASIYMHVYLMWFQCVLHVVSACTVGCFNVYNMRPKCMLSEASRYTVWGLSIHSIWGLNE